MSDKMTCPTCNARTSDVMNAARNDEPCPNCGTDLPAPVMDGPLCPRCGSIVALSIDAHDEVQADCDVCGWSNR